MRAHCPGNMNPGGCADRTRTGLIAQAVRCVASWARPGVGGSGVRASGGVRTAEDAEAMIAAGAPRLGVSGSRALLEGLK